MYIQEKVFHKKLTNIPVFTESDTEKVYLNNNGIKTLEDCAFCGRPDLHYLKLSDNIIDFISPNALNGTQLRFL